VPDPYDVLTIAAVVDELSATIGDGRIQRIGLADSRTIGAEIYARGRRHYLLASADDQLPRLRLAPEMPSLDPAQVTPFGLLLRKYARGGIILRIDQPPLERLVRFSIAKRLAPLKTRSHVSSTRETLESEDHDEVDDIAEDDNAVITHLALYVELMGRRSNLILVDDGGAIMESAKRVTPDMSRVRTILPRLPYTPPPPPDRRDPRSITAAEAQAFLSSLPTDADLARSLVSGFRGLSPQMAREIAFQVADRRDASADDLGANAAERMAQTIQALLEPLRTGDWSPRIYREQDSEGAGEIVAFSAIPMAHLAADYAEIAVGSISAAAALAETAEVRPSPQRHAQRRQRLLAAVHAARDRAERRLTALEVEAARAAEAERLRQAGELIYANLWQIAPGQAEFTVDGETIRLDPQLSPSENAQAFFERYRKAQSAEAQLPQLAQESHAEIAYLDQLATLIAQAPGFAELEALAAEWAEQSAPLGSARPRPRRRPAPRRPSALVDAAGNSVYVGRSGPQNDLLTFDLAGPDDTWLHARGVAGSHVIVRWWDPNAPEDQATIEAAAALAAWYSAARESGGVEVDIARRRSVRKIKGGRPGMVTYRNERTIRVQPAPEERLRDLLSER
jgi:predicted ribosome quality control (RQC) complex YloA/Tae2 family protein